MLDQSDFFHEHPIFTHNIPLDASFELSLNSLNDFRNLNKTVNETGRRSLIALRDSDLIFATGTEIRITPLPDAKTTSRNQRTYKTLHTPNIEFPIRQMCVNRSGKLLAVAGNCQVAVISLPRTGYLKLVPSKVECRAVQVGQYQHATKSAVPISKIEWHPWGKSACTLMYDISMDPEDPQQTLSFMPERSRASTIRGDTSSREVVSFCFGKGMADWGPLTVYALTKSGDIWAICPFLPSNAVIPSSYVHALEYFVRAKQDGVSNSQSQSDLDQQNSGRLLSTLYAQQLKYVVGLSKQIPESSSNLFVSPSRSISVSPPVMARSQPVRQGPFLFQPSPHDLDGDGGNATDIIYINAAGSSPLHSENDGNEEGLGVLVVAFSDGKIDVCLDVEKVEAMWDTTRHTPTDVPNLELPMLAVYETIDLGLVAKLSQAKFPESTLWFGKQPTSEGLLDLLEGNHPVFCSDPIYQDTVYLYHSFGVHSLNMSSWLQALASSMREGIENQVEKLVDDSIGTEVTCLLNTILPEKRASQPVIGICLPSDVYLTYCLFAATSALNFHVFELPLRIKEDPLVGEQQSPANLASLPPSVMSSVPALEAKDPSLVSLLVKEPYHAPALTSGSSFQTWRNFALSSPASKRELQITPEVLREFATIVHRFQLHIRDILISIHQLQERLMLQDSEFRRQQNKYMEIVALAERLKGEEHTKLQHRFEQAIHEQKLLLKRSDKVLQGLMDSSSPVLTEHEKRWFAELKRMKDDVLGVSSYDSGSLKARTDTLSNKLEYYSPSLKELSKRADQRRQESDKNVLALGRGQETRVLMRLGEQ
ncbi:hypothetical protein BU17DRAFT_73080 [Hysterangium stoloniferum]|nr:hypothetical protein BU17DRAFT_73080 [Hysterangium stoloniferum]